MSKINYRKILSFLLFLLILTFNFQLGVSPNPVEAHSSEPASFGIDENMWGVNGTINDIAVSDGYTYLAGSFTAVAPPESYTGKGLVLDIATAQRDTNFPKVDGVVNIAVPDGSGGWYIGGRFLSVGGYKRNNLAHISNDGTLDVLWNPNANSIVYTIAVSGADIYVGGFFTSIGGQSRNRIAKLNNTTGEADSTWNPNANSIVYTIAVSGSNIYAGGGFTTIGGQSRNRIAKLNNTTGEADPTWNPNAGNNVRSIVVFGDDIYVGGQFTTIGGQSRNRIAKLNNTTGEADPTWNPDANNTARSLVVTEEDIYVGGQFTTIGGQSRNRLAKLDKDTGAIDLTWDPNANNTVAAIAVTGTDIFAVGDFTTIGVQNRNRIVKLNNTTGEADLSWNINSDATSVASISVYGNQIYVSGNFYFMGETYSMNNICRIDNSTGEVDLDWNPNVGARVDTIAISGIDIYIGGYFTSVGGLSRNRIAKLNNTTGAVDSTWNPNSNNEVTTMFISGTDIYVGGYFTSIGGQSRSRIAKLDKNTGIADPTWNPNANNKIGTIVVCTIVVSGDDIYAGGDFTSIGGQSRNRIAKLNNTTGGANLTWNPNVADNWVSAIEVSGDDIYVGGYFSSIGGQSRNHIAKLNNTTGEVDLTWNPNATIGSSTPVVVAISVLGESVYVGGSFIAIGGQTREKIAKLNNNTGEADPSWDLLAGAGYWVNEILPYGDDIYVAGNFGSVGGVYRSGIARIYPDTEAAMISLNELSSPTSDNTPTFTGTGSDEIGAISSVEYQMDGTGGSWSSCNIDDGVGDEKSEEFTCSVSSALTEGTHTIYVRATDSNGNTTASGSETADEFIVDLTGPTGTISINSDETITNTDEVILTLSATDNLTEVSKMMVSNKVDYSGGTWETYNTSKEWRLSMGDGEKRVYVKYRDEVGNISSSYSDSIEMDMGAPTGTLIINEGEEYTSSREVVLHITGEDEVTGVEEMRISEDRTMEGVDWEGYETSREYTLSEGDGYKVIYIQYRDGIGNESEVYGSNITLDSNTEIEVTEIGEEEVEGEIENWETEETTPTFTGEGEVGATITIEIEGVETGTVIVNEDGVWSWTPSIELTRGQEYNVTITSRDLAGNEDTQTFTLGISDEEVIEVNQTTPEIQITTTQLPNTGVIFIIGLMILGGLIWTGMNFKVIEKLGWMRKERG